MASGSGGGFCRLGAALPRPNTDMSKPLKIVLIIIGAVFALIAVAATALVLTFDPNAYRDDIEKAVHEKTGRELDIAGDIGLSLFPWLGLQLGETSFGNAEGFGDDPFAKIGRVDVAVKLMPLIRDKRIEVGTVVLEGMALNLMRNEQGVSNWDDLAEIAASEDPPEPAPEPETPDSEPGFDLSSVGIGAIEIRNASLVYDDRQAKQRYAIQQINLETGALREGEPVNLSLGFLFESAAPALSAEFRLVSLLQADSEMKRFSADKLTLNLLARGDDIPGGEQQIEFSAHVLFEGDAGHLVLSDGQLQVADLKLAMSVDGQDLLGDAPQLEGQFSAAPFSPRELMETLDIEIPEPRDGEVLNSAALDLNFKSDLKSAAVPELKLALDDTQISGKVAMTSFATQALSFALKVDQIDVDRYLPPPSEEAPADTESASSEDLNSMEIPVDALEALNANGTIDIGTLKVSGMTMQDVQLKLAAPKGKTKAVDLAAKLYDGAIKTHTEIKPGATPSYSTDTALSSIKLGPLMKDFTGQDRISGSGDVNLVLNAAGKTVGDARKALNGTVSVDLADGAIKGANIGQAIRKAKAALNGETLQLSEPQQTDFASLITRGDIVDGVFTVNTLDLKNPLFRLAGNGDINLVAEQIDFLAKPTIVATSKGQGGADLDELNGLTIPIKIVGSLTDPKLSLNLRDALKEKAKDRAKEALVEHEDEIREKIDERLGSGAAEALRGLFGGSRKKKEEEKPAGDGGGAI